MGHHLYSGEDTSREAGSDFQLYVGDKLKERGYEITQEVGVAGFFIDIGVKHPKIPQNFIGFSIFSMYCDIS